MGREARKLSATGFYHVVFRGINHQHLFEEESDYSCFIEGLRQLKEQIAFEIHAYCLMSNHVHLLVREKQVGDISLIMKRLLTKYVMYFNRKYQRNGALIASRYKSIPVEVDEYFIPLLRYIHQNPLKAGMVEKMEEYRYSSYRECLNGESWVNTYFSLKMVGIDEWIRLHNIFEEGNFEVAGKRTMSEEQIRRKILLCTGGEEPYGIASWSKAEGDSAIHQLREGGLSIRQI